MFWFPISEVLFFFSPNVVALGAETRRTRQFKKFAVPGKMQLEKLGEEIGRWRGAPVSAFSHRKTMARNIKCVKGGKGNKRASYGFFSLDGLCGMW